MTYRTKIRALRDLDVDGVRIGEGEVAEIRSELVPELLRIAACEDEPLLAVLPASAGDGTVVPVSMGMDLGREAEGAEALGGELSSPSAKEPEAGAAPASPDAAGDAAVLEKAAEAADNAASVSAEPAPSSAKPSGASADDTEAKPAAARATKKKGS